MKVRVQVAMVPNLDKCIGCHTCSVMCKNVWISHEGMEYAWSNSVETKPDIGYPKDWENQERWRGGWVCKADGKLQSEPGGKRRLLVQISASLHLPEIDGYHESFTSDYAHLQTAGDSAAMPVVRPRSLISGERLEKTEWGPNQEEILGGEFEKQAKDYNLGNVQKGIYGQFKSIFMICLSRLCEHCLNPTYVAACPSGSIYKREGDGIVLVDQDKCRGWRMCVSGCLYKKIYFSWKSGKAEKCIFRYPRIEVRQPTVCSETCVGRIRYLSVLLYDADRISEAVSVEQETDLYESQLPVFFNPHDPQATAQAERDGVSIIWIEGAQRSPVYEMVIDWKIAFSPHPECCTLPMVWYVPPLSPINAATNSGELGMNGYLSDVDLLRIPLRYLASLLTAGKEAPVKLVLERMLAMCALIRARHVDGAAAPAVLTQVGLTIAQAEEMYRYLAITNYEDRFVTPTTHHEYTEDASDLRVLCGFSFGNRCSDGTSDAGPFSSRKSGRTIPIR